MELGAFSVSLAVKDIEASKLFNEKLGFTVFAGEICIIYFGKPLGMSEIKIFPYDKIHDRKKYDGVCPECGDEYKR